MRVYAALRAEYVAHIARLLSLAGEPTPPREAQSILELETRIAKVALAAAKRRERDLTYNPRTRPELEQMAPGFFWETLLDRGRRRAAAVRGARAGCGAVARAAVPAGAARAPGAPTSGITTW